ncbi:hypothetical protein AB0424_28795 [Streptomyces sp. NPDC051180]|uniref:hypothetical protein n=1 Tax=unclassified Streptomyces TaxID=2593676 RepID=UPI00344EBEA3
MNGPLDLRVLVLLLAGVVIGYIAYKHPDVGVALIVAATVVTLIYLLMGSGGSGSGSPPPR